MRGHDRRSLTVLVVDDSAVVREVMGALLSQEEGISVITAPDPLIAMEKMKGMRPDVILLDLEMPRMDGLTFLRKIMAEDPIPVVVCSGLAGHGTEAALRALEEGAVEVIAKPKFGIRHFLHESALMLIDAVQGAAQACLRRRGLLPASSPSLRTADAVLPPPRKSALTFTSDKVVAIGASTGGTEALRVILEAMPPDAPGVVVVQHMPEGFTAAFATRLNQTCQIEVKEASRGDWVREGRALIAPGNRHTMLVRSGAHYAVEVTDGPLVSRHRPSADVLFRSVAQAAGPNAVGVILTGMGNDGATGLLEMRRAGAATIAQDEATCVVFGMPKEAISRGAVDEVIPLPQIPMAALRKARAPAGAMG
ncbi:MAG TPA: chemotaxis response regulator protein-glutamate methylesterase [Candidatus Methylomirabilis sp.]|nr:chemotaxis response regulator protein-glutamate methylesterase [Candidatus Methylomirabilis sp.]